MTNLGILARFPLGVYQGHKADGSPDAFPDPARAGTSRNYRKRAARPLRRISQGPQVA